MTIISLAIIFFGLSSNAVAETPVSKVSCGVINMDGEWLKKPITIPRSKDGADFPIYDVKNLRIALNLRDDNLVVTATKSKNILAALVTEDASRPIQVLVPNTGLQVLCNSSAFLMKFTIP